MKDYWQLKQELKGSSKLVNESWDAFWKEWSRRFGGNAALVKKLRGGWSPTGEWSELWAETIIREYGLEKTSSKSSKSDNSSKPKKLNPSDFRFDPEDKKIFTKLSKGKKDNLGFPNFSGVTICDLVSLPLDDMLVVFEGVLDDFWSDDTRELFDAWDLDGMKTLESVAEKIDTAFKDWFGSGLMGRGKESVLGVFRAIQACSTRADWTKPDFKGSLYRGKTMSWDKLKELKWKRVGGDLYAEGIYQSRLGAQSWTRSIAVAKNFARNAGTAGSGSPEAELHISGISGGVMPKPGTAKVSGSAPVIVSAEVPKEQCMLSERASRQLSREAGIGDYEQEVIRVSNAPIKAKFILTKGTLSSAVRADSEAVAYIYKTLLREK
jgi:hypothetical protein